jgi:hypothetical protein
VTGLDAAQAAQDTLIAAKADKTYVDSQDALKAPLASPALTGNPTAPTPTAGDADTSIATTAFVAAALAAAAAATSIGDAPPSSPKVGQLWWQSSTGRLFIYYQDANTSQWVEVPGPNIDTTGFVKETTGLWTPTIYGSTAAGVGTYTVQQGRWTRHGRIVYLEGSLTWTAHTGTGNIFIGGLPFGSIGNPSAICTAVYGSGLTFSGQLTGYVSASTGTGIGIQTFASGGNAAGLAMDTAASIQVNAVFATDNP